MVTRNGNMKKIKAIKRWRDFWCRVSLPSLTYALTRLFNITRLHGFSFIPYLSYFRSLPLFMSISDYQPFCLTASHTHEMRYRDTEIKFARMNYKQIKTSTSIHSHLYTYMNILQYILLHMHTYLTKSMSIYNCICHRECNCYDYHLASLKFSITNPI